MFAISDEKHVPPPVGECSTMVNKFILTEYYQKHAFNEDLEEVIFQLEMTDLFQVPQSDG